MKKLGVMDAAFEESFRVIRTNIQFSGFENKIKTIAITSTRANEGKSTVAINLAASIAKSGLKVLLVDADLRKQKGRNYYCVDIPGLSNVISGYTTMDEVVILTNTDNLYFITCGTLPPNPTELLTSEKFKEFFDNVRDKYDMVIYDTPPLGAVIDCAIISAQTDGTIFVIQSKAIDYKSAQRVKEQLEKANSRILGIVLNKVNRKEFKSYYNDFNYYSYKITDIKDKKSRKKIRKENSKDYLSSEKKQNKNKIAN